MSRRSPWAAGGQEPSQPEPREQIWHRGSNPPFHLRGEGQQMTFCKPKLLCSCSQQCCVQSRGFFSFSVFYFFFFHGCSRGWGEVPHLNWEWFCCNSPQAGASLSCCWASAASEAVLRHWAISFIFLQHPFGVLPSASNDGVLAKPFVGAKPAEPSSHLYPAVSLSLSDQPQLTPLNFSEPQLNLDIKSVENRSISSFVS